MNRKNSKSDFASLNATRKDLRPQRKGPCHVPAILPLKTQHDVHPLQPFLRAKKVMKKSAVANAG